MILILVVRRFIVRFHLQCAQQNSLNKKLKPVNFHSITSHLKIVHRLISRAARKKISLKASSSPSRLTFALHRSLVADDLQLGLLLGRRRLGALRRRVAPAHAERRPIKLGDVELGQRRQTPLALGEIAQQLADRLEVRLHDVTLTPRPRRELVQLVAATLADVGQEANQAVATVDKSRERQQEFYAKLQLKFI